MIALTRKDGQLIKLFQSPSESGSFFGFHPHFGFISENLFLNKKRNHEKNGIKGISEDWAFRFNIKALKNDSLISVQNTEKCEAKKISPTLWALTTPVGEFSLNTQFDAVLSPFIVKKEVEKPFWKVPLIASLSLLSLVLMTQLFQQEEIKEPEILEPVEVKIIPQIQKVVQVAPSDVMNSIQVKDPALVKKAEVKRAVEQNLGFLGILGRKNLTKALGGAPSKLKDVSAGAGAGGTEGSGGELLVGLGQGVKRTTVGNSGVKGLGGIGTKGAGGGAGGYGNAVVGSGEGRSLSSMPLSNDIVLDGGLDRSVIQATIAKYLSQVRACYEIGLGKNPGLGGQVTVNFEIGGSGLLNYSKVAKSTLGNSEVESCITTRMMKWNFPKPLGGVNVKVAYPFLLRPAGA